MAPLIEKMAALAKRADGCGTGNFRGSDGFCYSHSGWYWWGRWVFAGIAILFVLLVFAAAFRNSRRRRKQGVQPMYGTGWMAPAPPPYYPPPPQYTPQGAPYPPPGGYKVGENDGYYGGNQYGGNQHGGPQQEGIQLQQPQNTYHRSADAGDFAPPPGPPPNAAK